MLQPPFWFLQLLVSRRQPTPIWAQKLSEDGTKLVGEMKELLRNDAPWEKQLVEGPFVLRRNGYFYMFYSGNGCCGAGCNYALGVARAKQLLGWEPKIDRHEGLKRTLAYFQKKIATAT